LLLSKRLTVDIGEYGSINSKNEETRTKQMTESHLRSLIKAISWRVFATLITMIITYLITHQLTLAFYVGFFEFFSKIFLFYIHERIWGWIPLGIKRTGRLQQTIQNEFS
jgi:adenylylsulfate kinase